MDWFITSNCCEVRVAGRCLVDGRRLYWELDRPSGRQLVLVVRKYIRGYGGTIMFALLDNVFYEATYNLGLGIRLDSNSDNVTMEDYTDCLNAIKEFVKAMGCGE